MRSRLAAALAPTAGRHHLGSLVSVHARERPLIRFRARWLWVFIFGPVVGLAWAVYHGDRPATDAYALYPDGVFLGGLAVVYLGGMVVVPLVAARLAPPSGPRRWVALYEHGLVDITAASPDVDPDDSDPDGPGHDLIVRPVRFDQVRSVDQHRESITATPQARIATSGYARLVAERDGKRLVLTYHGFRHQDRFLDVARERLAGEPTRRTVTALRQRGRVAFGDLVIDPKALTATGGLRPSEQPTLRWRDVVQVNERDDGTLTVLRRADAGSPAAGSPAAAAEPVVWFSAVVPDASEAAAMITRMRNRHLA